ncbi:hypothetical protein [uncultured Planktosalinus sp.]|uniref:hypothetical protein n=1 Tax=uncultured Planktosalinus sp. TaxID=1810935 RepID=UPI0030DB8367
MIFLKNIFIQVALLISLTIYTCQVTGIGLPAIINNYVNNLLCMPLVLTSCLIVLQKIKSNNRITIPIFVIASVTLYYILFFEWYLPTVNPRYTADLIDVCLYIVGGVIFYFLQNKHIPHHV